MIAIFESILRLLNSLSIVKRCPWESYDLFTNMISLFRINGNLDHWSNQKVFEFKMLLHARTYSAIEDNNCFCKSNTILIRSLCILYYIIIFYNVSMVCCLTVQTRLKFRVGVIDSYKIIWGPFTKDPTKFGNKSITIYRNI